MPRHKYVIDRESFECFACRRGIQRLREGVEHSPPLDVHYCHLRIDDLHTIEQSISAGQGRALPGHQLIDPLLHA